MQPHQTYNSEESISRMPENFDDSNENAPSPITREFQDAALRIVVQRNDFLLPNLIDMMRVHKTIEISPAYQRRLRWDPVRKSKLIESFLVNIPVPPVFLYETDFARYEVMDGQQRLATLWEYYENSFALAGMDILTNLHGLRYRELPSVVRAGLDRRYLSSIILLKESTPSSAAATLLRQKVFERLNTGGIGLNAQEVRNCVFAGPFNDLLLQLSRNELFTRMWDVPPPEPDESARPSRKLANNSLYKRMADVELVLRVFALLDSGNVGSGMKSTLDYTANRLAHLQRNDLEMLRRQFTDALSLAYLIGGKDIFRIPASRVGQTGRLSASLYDAIMVALIRLLDRSHDIERAAETISNSLRSELNNPIFKELVVGRANTRVATLERSNYVQQLIMRAVDGTRN